ncbi:MAG: hypothetical protein LUG91_09045 [Ruminococcus sp.]|nr:hypothetical protein [Ruminococcus sp.]
MAQDYYVLQGSGIIKEDRSKINDNFATVASDFAGSVFPTHNVEIGTTCYRTDLKKTYRYVEENVWQDISNEITMSVMTGASSSAAGAAGLVPTPAAGAQEKFLRGDGTWQTPIDTDTKVTNTLEKTTKAYVTGTTSSTTNTGTQVFDTGVYLDAEAGMLTAETFKGALVGNADTATSATTATTATNDSEGQNIANTYIKALDISDTTLTYTKGDGDTGSFVVDVNLNASSSVTGSTQPERYILDTNEPNLYDYDEYENKAPSSAGAYGKIRYRYYYYTHPGITEDTYKLQNLLQELVNMSHTHTVIAERYQCEYYVINCNCSDG